MSDAAAREKSPAPVGTPPEPAPPFRAERGLSFAQIGVALGALTALSRFAFRARTPDGFDSIDFLLGMSKDFDMAKLQPHFPGYPVYVALGRGLVHLGVPAITAGTAISSLAAGAAAIALAVCADSLYGRRAGLAALLLNLFAWQGLLLGGAALSDSLGLALAASSFALLARDRPAWSGVAAGLLLGTRASYFPLVGSLLFLRWRRRRLWGGLVLGTLAWSVPFFWVVGVSNFVKLGTEHVKGHFGWWGGSIETRPDLLARAAAFVRDVFYDGLAPAWWALLVLGVLALLVARVRKEDRGRVRGPVVLSVILLPYALWIFLGQNVLEQPRHALPLAAALVVVLAGLLSRRPWTVLVACAALAAASLPLALERHHLPSASEQAAEWLEKNEPPADTAIMAGRSWRFFSELPEPFTVRAHAWLSEVIVDLTRFPRLPPNVFITSEIDVHSGGGPRTPLPHAWTLEQGPNFCRDARIDRYRPCLSLSRLTWTPR